MNLELDLDNDSEFEESLEKGVGGGFTKTDDLEWVESGLYKCFIASAILVHRSNGDAISCTFVALDNDGNEPIGKFSSSYSVEPSDKYFGKTKELCFLTGNGSGLVETKITNKDGEDVLDGQGNPMYKYEGLCSNEFQLIATVLRKAGDYEAPNGKVYANYTVFNLFDTEKRSAREKWLIEKKGADPAQVPAKDIGKAYAYLKQRIAKEQESADALNAMEQKASKPAVKTTPRPAPKPVPRPVARPAPKLAPAPVQEEPDMVAEDDLPF